jgi:predicted CopG family antitoxin|tara:strand:- start:904 stop:1029 length:126 start_codon:yes stop_codon:yes gene_type:complete
MEPKLKTIKIKENTHKKLVEFGRKGETFSDIIDKLIKERRK